MKKLDLTGHVYGQLTVIKEDFSKKRSSWFCKCLCGNDKVISLSHLRNRDRHTRSCGCLINNSKPKKVYKRKQSPRIATAKRVWKRRYSDGDISFEKFLELSQQNCFYCNESPSNKSNHAAIDKNASEFAKNNGDFIYNGLDRIDNFKKHNIENIVTCCWKCNRAKRNMAPKEFYNWIVKSYNNIYGIRN